jgi:hypothetical protein
MKCLISFRRDVCDELHYCPAFVRPVRAGKIIQDEDIRGRSPLEISAAAPA